MQKYLFKNIFDNKIKRVYEFIIVFIIFNIFIMLTVMQPFPRIVDMILGSLIFFFVVYFPARFGYFGMTFSTLYTSIGIVFLVELFLKNPESLREHYLSVIFFQLSALLTGILTGILTEINRKKESKLKELAEHDVLTGVMNRRAGMLIFEKVAYIIEREKKDLTVCFCDIDGLKEVNDNLGHDVGDQLIKEFVESIKKSIRNSDIPIRLGGDEFLIVFPYCNVEDATKIVKRALLSCSVSFSYGFSSYNGSEELNVDKLVKESDDNMYEMKRKNKK